MSRVHKIVDSILEGEDIDWSHLPADDPDAAVANKGYIDANVPTGAVTKEVCMNARNRQEFYYRPTGQRARVNGKCQTWKREPDKFKLPMKYGLYDYFYITQDNAADWSTIPVEVPNAKRR